MQATYIFHSGFLVESHDRYYLFDYYQGRIPLLNSEKPVVVLASHGHKDHYNPEVFELLRQAGAKNVSAVLAKDIPQRKYPPNINVLKAYAHQTYPLPGGDTLETLLSTDSGVAFLLTTKEGTIYHAGDLNDWSWEGESAKSNLEMETRYRQEIDLLKGRHLNFAFVVLDPRQEQYRDNGMLYFLRTCEADAVYPMHYWQKPEVIGDFKQKYPSYAPLIKDTESYGRI